MRRTQMTGRHDGLPTVRDQVLEGGDSVIAATPSRASNYEGTFKVTSFGDQASGESCQFFNISQNPLFLPGSTHYWIYGLSITRIMSSLGPSPTCTKSINRHRSDLAAITTWVMFLPMIAKTYLWVKSIVAVDFLRLKSIWTFRKISSKVSIVLVRFQALRSRCHFLYIAVVVPGVTWQSVSLSTTAFRDC